MNKISLKNALKNALLAQFREESMSDPAIVYENGEFAYESAIHGATVIIDLNEGCGTFYIETEADAENVAEQWLEWCVDEIEDQMEGLIRYEPKTDQSRLTSWAKNFRPKKQEPFLDLRETARKI